MRTGLVKRVTTVIAVGFAVAAMSVAFNGVTAPAALAASASAIDRDAKAALDKLYKQTPGAKALADKAVAVLVFPSIVKGGFIIAGQFGDGALRKNGKSVAYYRSLAASYGFQAGVQEFGYVLFFMDDASLQYLNNSDGWELGVGPSLVRRGVRQESVNDNAPEKRLRVYLRPEGLDGRRRYPGIEDYQNQPESLTGQNSKHDKFK